MLESFTTNVYYAVTLSDEGSTTKEKIYKLEFTEYEEKRRWETVKNRTINGMEDTTVVLPEKTRRIIETVIWNANDACMC